MPTRKHAVFAAMAAAFILGVAVADARDLRPPATNNDQSYLYLDPGPSRPNLPGYMQESMDPSNEPFAGTMFGEDEQDEAPASFGLDDND
jgi:hypothetical protein